MTPKEINRESGRYFGAKLLPSWAVRSQEDQEDYGVDSEIELTTSEDKATGFIFKIQLKGTTIANFNDAGQLVFSDASVDRFNYYLSKLKIPLIFVVCDVTTGECYWTKVQGNRRLEKDHANAVAKKQGSFTIKIPVSQKVEKTEGSADQVVQAVEDAQNALVLRTLQTLSPDTLRQNIGHEPDLEDAEKRVRLLAGIYSHESIKKLLQSGQVDAACKKAQSLLESTTESPEVRFLGGWSLAHCRNISLRKSGMPGAGFEAAKYKIGIASRMLEVVRTKGCQVGVKRFSCIYARAARMHINGRSTMALATSENVQAEQGETMAGPITALQRLEVSSLVARDFLKLRNNLFRLGRDGFYSVMPYSLVEATESIFPYVGALRLMDKNDLADAYVEALFDFLPFCIGIIQKFDNPRDTEEILHSLGLRFISLANGADPESMPALLHRYEDALKVNPEFECIDSIKAALRQQVEDLSKGTGNDIKPTMDELRKYYADRAAELGINLNDPDDQFAAIVRIGLKDLDPTRVSKNCRHIHVMTTSYGMPAEMLGLPTAGSKRVVCLKHGHSIETLELDRAYESFKELRPWDTEGLRCENCPDTDPHSDDWQWSQEWDTQQVERYRALTKTKDTAGDSEDPT